VETQNRKLLKRRVIMKLLWKFTPKGKKNEGERISSRCAGFTSTRGKKRTERVGGGN